MKWIPYSKTQLKGLKNILDTTLDRTEARKVAIQNFALVNNRSITSVSQKLSSLGRKYHREASKKPFANSNHVRINQLTIPIKSIKIDDKNIIITY